MEDLKKKQQELRQELEQTRSNALRLEGALMLLNSLIAEKEPPKKEKKKVEKDE